MESVQLFCGDAWGGSEDGGEIPFKKNCQFDFMRLQKEKVRRGRGADFLEMAKERTQRGDCSDFAQRGLRAFQSPLRVIALIIFAFIRHKPGNLEKNGMPFCMRFRGDLLLSQ